LKLFFKSFSLQNSCFKGNLIQSLIVKVELWGFWCHCVWCRAGYVVGAIGMVAVINIDIILREAFVFMLLFFCLFLNVVSVFLSICHLFLL
jgi:hypothetical protein